MKSPNQNMLKGIDGFRLSGISCKQARNATKMLVHRMINTVAGKKMRKSERVAEYICSRVMFMVEKPFWVFELSLPPLILFFLSCQTSPLVTTVVLGKMLGRGVEASPFPR